MSRYTHLRSLMQSHDWFYEYADGNENWTSEFNKRHAIIDIMKTIPMIDAHDLITNFCPADMREVFLLQLQGLRYMN